MHLEDIIIYQSLIQQLGKIAHGAAVSFNYLHNKPKRKESEWIKRESCSSQPHQTHNITYRGKGLFAEIRIRQTYMSLRFVILVTCIIDSGLMLIKTIQIRV